MPTPHLEIDNAILNVRALSEHLQSLLKMLDDMELGRPAIDINNAIIHLASVRDYLEDAKDRPSLSKEALEKILLMGEHFDVLRFSHFG